MSIAGNAGIGLLTGLCNKTIGNVSTSAKAVVAISVLMNTSIGWERGGFPGAVATAVAPVFGYWIGNNLVDTCQRQLQKISLPRASAWMQSIASICHWGREAIDDCSESLFPLSYYANTAALICRTSYQGTQTVFKDVAGGLKEIGGEAFESIQAISQISKKALKRIRVIAQDKPRILQTIHQIQITAVAIAFLATCIFHPTTTDVLNLVRSVGAGIGESGFILIAGGWAFTSWYLYKPEQETFALDTEDSSIFEPTIRARNYGDVRTVFNPSIPSEPIIQEIDDTGNVIDEKEEDKKLLDGAQQTSFGSEQIFITGIAPNELMQMQQILFDQIAAANQRAQRSSFGRGQLEDLTGLGPSSSRGRGSSSIRGGFSWFSNRGRK